MIARPLFSTRPLVAAMAVLAASGGAWADEPNPYYIGVTEAVTHDGNVYRVPDGPSDTYTSTGLVGGFDQSYGRQHVYGAGNVRYNKYRSESTLDNTSYGLNAGWDWSTIEKLSGNVNVSAAQSLATFNGNSIQPTTERQQVRTAQISTGVRWGGPGRFSLGGDYSHSIVRYNGQAVDNSNSSADTLGANLYYNVSPDLTAGIGYRVTRTVQPNGLFVPPDQFDDLTSRGRNVDLTLNYHYSAQTNFAGRLSFTRQSNSGTAGQDFSGLTGSINANYMPTGKIGLSLGYARDAGTNGNFFNAPSSSSGGTTTLVTGLNRNSQTTDSLTLGATYAATAKIGVSAGYTYRRAKIVGSSSVSGVSTDSSYNDNLKVATLGVNYAALRWLNFGCNLSHENRSVSASGGYSYSANVVGCNAQATLR